MACDQAPAHRGDDGQRDAGRPRDVPCRGDGRLHHQTDPGGPVGRSLDARAGAPRLIRIGSEQDMDESVIDKAVYAELEDTAGAEFVVELVNTFLEEAPGMLAELRSARAENHADRFRRAAHSLKSNSDTFGALRSEEHT